MSFRQFQVAEPGALKVAEHRPPTVKCEDLETKKKDLETKKKDLETKIKNLGIKAEKFDEAASDLAEKKRQLKELASQLKKLAHKLSITERQKTILSELFKKSEKLNDTLAGRILQLEGVLGKNQITIPQENFFEYNDIKICKK